MTSNVPGLALVYSVAACVQHAPSIPVETKRCESTLPHEGCASERSQERAPPTWNIVDQEPLAIQDATRLGTSIELIGSLRTIGLDPCFPRHAQATVRITGAGVTQTVLDVDDSKPIIGGRVVRRNASDPIGLLFRYEAFPYGGLRSEEYAIVHRDNELIVFEGKKDDCGVDEGGYFAQRRIVLAPNARIVARDASP
jgi:hypothetical protein